MKNNFIIAQHFSKQTPKKEKKTRITYTNKQIKHHEYKTFNTKNVLKVKAISPVADRSLNARWQHFVNWVYAGSWDVNSTILR